MSPLRNEVNSLINDYWLLGTATVVSAIIISKFGGRVIKWVNETAGISQKTSAQMHIILQSNDPALHSEDKFNLSVLENDNLLSYLQFKHIPTQMLKERIPSLAKELEVKKIYELTFDIPKFDASLNISTDEIRKKGLQELAKVLEFSNEKRDLGYLYFDYGNIHTELMNDPEILKIFNIYCSLHLQERCYLLKLKDPTKNYDTLQYAKFADYLCNDQTLQRAAQTANGLENLELYFTQYSDELYLLNHLLLSTPSFIDYCEQRRQEIKSLKYAQILERFKPVLLEHLSKLKEKTEISRLAIKN